MEANVVNVSATTWCDPPSVPAMRGGPCRNVSSESAPGLKAPSFERPCVAQFEWLAENEPTELVRMSLSTLDAQPALLSQAAEALGKSKLPELAVATLLVLLEHREPLVREGAIYGIARFLETSLQARDTLRQIAMNDPSRGVREAAADALLLLTR